MEYRYRTLGGHEVESKVKELARLARSVSCLKLGIKAPELIWIRESDNGLITWRHPIAAYASTRGDIFIRADMKPFAIAAAVIHETRHIWQKQQTKQLSPEFRERDAKIYEREFWAGHEKWAGDFLAVGRALLDREAALRKAKPAALPTKPRRAYDSDYPGSGRMKVFAPSDEEMKEGWLRAILNG